MDKEQARKERRNSAQFKKTAVERMGAGVISLSALAAELKVRRGLLYRWRDQWKRWGEAAFHRKVGRPPGVVTPGPGRPVTAVGGEQPLVRISAERRRIAELEQNAAKQQEQASRSAMQGQSQKSRQSGEQASEGVEEGSESGDGNP